MVEMRYDYKDAIELFTVPIVDVLSLLGYSDKHRGDMFYSPFRNEAVPSFHINQRCNVWYDHGAGIGGGVLDLVKLLLDCTVREAMNFLADIKGVCPHQVQQVDIINPTEKASLIEVVKTYSPIINPTLIQYASLRGISNDILNRYCKEIVYSVKGKDNHQFHAIGFPNCQGGYVLRSSRHKRCTSSAPTWIDSNDEISTTKTSDVLYIFEGFMDFLSWKMMNEFTFDRYDCCVLNSVNNLGKVISRISQYETVKTFLDNDEAGLKAFSQLAQALQMTEVSISEMSGLYDGYKDLNEMLVDTRLSVKHFNT